MNKLQELRGINLTKVIDGRTILDVSEISVASGRCTAIVGPNGAGKSMLLRALVMSDPPTSGVVRVDGVEYRFPEASENLAPPWPKVTACFQQLFLWPHLTLRRSVELPLRNFPDKQERIRRTARHAELLGITQLLDRYPNECSGGERQRAALLRAVALEPRYLLCDEPTSAVDIETTQVILALLDSLKKSGTGVLLITHMLGFAARVADEVVFLEGGRMVERGRTEILRAPRSERMRRFVSLLESVGNGAGGEARDVVR